MVRLLQTFLAAISIVFCMTVGGAIEGRYFPVVENTKLTQIQPVNGTHSRIWGEADRVRDCDFERLEWRIGTDNRSSLVDLHFEEGSKVRPSGEFTFGPWLVQLTPVQLLDRSYAVAFHRCHPFWLTETHFYP